MSLIRRLDTHHKLYASFALLLCLSMGLSLWMLGRLEQMSLLTAAPAQKLSGLAEQAQAGYTGARLLAWAAIGVTLAAALMLGLWLHAEFARPVQQAAAMARRMAAGDLSSKIGAPAAGEAGAMLDNMQEMNDGLASMIVRLRAGTESIAGSAGQIAAGSAALASRCDEQAAALAQAAALIAQLAAGASAGQAKLVEQAGELIAAIGQASRDSARLVAQSAAAAAAMRDQAGNLSRTTAAFVLGPEHGVALPAIRLVSNNPVPLVRRRPIGELRNAHAPAPAIVTLAPVPKRSQGAFGRRSIDREEF